MRCVNMASGLARSGADVSFVCRELQGHLCDEITAQGFQVARLPMPNRGMVQQANEQGLPVHSSWLGTTWQVDARETASAIAEIGGKVDWLVVDHYALDQSWESTLRPDVQRILVIDDLMDRRHNCDLLLNQNVFPDGNPPYQGMIPPHCGLLLGPRYALLQPAYRDFWHRAAPREGNVTRILVYFGGVDENNMTGRTLVALLKTGRTDIAVDVVVPIGSPHKDEIRLLGRRLGSQAHLHDTLPSLAQLMVSADLAIGASGTTSWERLCLGLPALVITLSDNQVMIADTLNRHQLANWLGHFDAVSDDELAAAITTLLDAPLDPDWSARCRAVVDGKGVSRVLAVMAYCPQTPLRARNAGLDDGPLIGDWATSLFLSNGAMSVLGWNNRQECYRAFLRNLSSSRLYVIETDAGAIIGVVHASYSDGAWHLRHAVSPVVPGTVGSDRRCIVTALRQLRRDERGILRICGWSMWEPAAALDRPVANTTAPSQIAICSDQSSWINDFIPDPLLTWLEHGHQIVWGHDAAQLPNGDVCFYLSYGRIIGKELLAKYRNNLVVHESDLPAGRGWSPLTWQILQGADEITITLFEAAESVDAGAIYLQTKVRFFGTELVTQLRASQAQATFALCSDFLAGYPEIIRRGRVQSGTPSYFPRRTAGDSRLDLTLPLGEQISLLRVCDNDRYPAWFEFSGSRFVVRVSKADDN